MTPVLSRIAGLSLADHTVQSLLHELCVLVLEALPAAVEVSMTVVDEDQARTVATTGPRALQLDERQYALGHGPCVDGPVAGAVVHIRDMRTEQRWPDYTPLAVELGIHSSLGLPLPFQRDVVCALNAYAEEVDAYDETAVRIALEVAASVGVVVTNMRDIEANHTTADKLRQMMASRAVIEQAKGMLMAQRRCTAETAFDLMVQLAQATDRSLRELAEHMVAEVE